jgi:hypothetical protein
MKFSLKKQIFYLVLFTLCLISVTGAAVYYFYALDWLGISLSLFISGISIFYFAKLIFKRREKKAETVNASDIAKHFIAPKSKNQLKALISLVSLIPYLLLIATSFLLLFNSRTASSLTSPWQAVAPNFFLVYAAATAYLTFLILKNYKFSLYLIIFHYFLSFSVLWIVFKIGYGYDPFIHQATVSLIDKQGAVEPKPLYYLGQYSLVLITHKLLFIPIVWLDKLLVPVLAAITIPPTILLFQKKHLNNSSFIINHLSLIIVTILPFSIFTITVPQNLAYLFLILAIFFTITASNKAEKIIGLLLALAAFAVHPIAGLPALLFVGTVFIYRRGGKQICFNNLAKTNERPEKICIEKPTEDVLILKSSAKKLSFKDVFGFLLGKKLFYAAIFVINAVSLPILFWLAQKNNATGVSDNNATATPGFSLPTIVFPQRENIFLDFVYFFQANLWLILIITSLIAAYAIWRWRKKYGEFLILGEFSLSLLIAYILTSQIKFNFLISYERGDFANRVLTEAFLFLLPIIAIILYKFIGRIMESKPLLKYSWLIFLTLMVVVSFYGSYPRRDNLFNSHGFSVGQSDLEAVNWIETDALNTPFLVNRPPYVVLANQQVSVAALWTFGFSRYFTNDMIYFYPIPTGGPLYQIYLDMVYKKPDRATALRAADLTGAEIVYFVINKYWTGFDKIVEQAKIESDSYENLDNGEIYIFKYLK